MEAVKVLRLKSGEDIIAYLEQVDKLNFIVREPMVFMFKNNPKTGKDIVMMDHWLPAQLLKHNEAFLAENEIVTILEPTSEFSEYFENAVDSIHKAKSMVEELSESNEEEMSQLDGIGEAVSKSIIQWMKNEENRNIIEKLRKAEVDFSHMPARNENSTLEGKKILVTGKISGIGRDQIKEMIVDRGGIYISSVSEKLDFLIAGEKATSAKVKKAESLGVEICSAEDFNELLETGKVTRVRAGQNE